MKSPLTSRTFWINLIAVIASGAMMLGLDLPIDAEAQTAIVTGIMGVVNLILRFRTSTPISFKPEVDPLDTDPPTGI